MLLLINFVHGGSSQQVPPKRRDAIYMYDDYRNISVLGWITWGDVLPWSQFAQAVFLSFIASSSCFEIPYDIYDSLMPHNVVSWYSVANSRRINCWVQLLYSALAIQGALVRVAVIPYLAHHLVTKLQAFTSWSCGHFHWSHLYSEERAPVSIVFRVRHRGLHSRSGRAEEKISLCW
jgi:hypothetical protein